MDYYEENYSFKSELRQLDKHFRENNMGTFAALLKPTPWKFPKLNTQHKLPPK